MNPSPPAPLLPSPGRSYPAKAGWRPQGRRRPRERRKPPAASAADGASARQASFRPQCSAALEARSVHNDPPQKSYEWAAGSPSREPTCAIIRARTLRNLLFPGSREVISVHSRRMGGVLRCPRPSGADRNTRCQSATTGPGPHAACRTRTLRVRPRVNPGACARLRRGRAGAPLARVRAVAAVERDLHAHDSRGSRADEGHPARHGSSRL